VTLQIPDPNCLSPFRGAQQNLAIKLCTNIILGFQIFLFKKSKIQIQNIHKLIFKNDSVTSRTNVLCEVYTKDATSVRSKYTPVKPPSSARATTTETLAPSAAVRLPVLQFISVSTYPGCTQLTRSAGFSLARILV
jgi:hypothetical protein